MRPYGRQPLVCSLVSVPASGVVSFQWAATALQAPSARVPPRRAGAYRTVARHVTRGVTDTTVVPTGQTRGEAGPGVALKRRSNAATTVRMSSNVGASPKNIDSRIAS